MNASTRCSNTALLRDDLNPSPTGPDVSQGCLPSDTPALLGSCALAVAARRLFGANDLEPLRLTSRQVMTIWVKLLKEKSPALSPREKRWAGRSRRDSPRKHRKCLNSAKSPVTCPELAFDHRLQDEVQPKNGYLIFFSVQCPEND